jgi:hypothetical protein
MFFIGVILAITFFRSSYGAVLVPGTVALPSYKETSHNLLPDDIFSLADVVNTATAIQKSEKQHQNNEVLEFSKEISGMITFVLEVRVNFSGWLTLVTCYRQKKVR